MGRGARFRAHRVVWPATFAFQASFRLLPFKPSDRPVPLTTILAEEQKMQWCAHGVQERGVCLVVVGAVRFPGGAVLVRNHLGNRWGPYNLIPLTHLFLHSHFVSRKGRQAFARLTDTEVSRSVSIAVGNPCRWLQADTFGGCTLRCSGFSKSHRVGAVPERGIAPTQSVRAQTFVDEPWRAYIGFAASYLSWTSLYASGGVGICPFIVPGYCCCSCSWRATCVLC
jgi:hypothetical protein